MPLTDDELEAQLIRLERKFEAVGDGTYLVSMGPGRPPAAVRLAPPVVVFRVEIGEIGTGSSSADQNALLRHLLSLNAGGLLHAGYGLEGNRIVLGAALESRNLDLNELDAVLSDLDLALTEHVGKLRELAAQRS